ncbi:hypothetical protein HBI56_162460 [Parastagonospora nodorum]|nr:hypothetical protein HBH56_210180 [Parastagonospora nodorum]KAH3931173.1 hypothetical protein HBH54_098790 [Parastagonospora nodorum]KAH3944242.1 hypothetical protein HBH53_160250 [Parastagonospora nodorum]KAH3960691.1 hypothetical protein HBH51_188540 [Parastagonospora nodorum]KAH3962901.1 hypothetical protein HBH52_221210 [Parastagonospora nodorum]
MWHDRIVYYRDFAYNRQRARMANGSIGDVPAATFAELLSGPMIDIYVGEAKRHWSLHRNLLCHHSEILETELEGDGNGSRRKDKLELYEYDPAGFELLVKWLYQGKLDDVSDMVDANQKYEYAVSCHKLYLLCDRLDMPQLKNVAMDQYRKGLNQAELVPDADEIDEIYRKSPVGSPFRKLMTRIAARQIMDPGNERDVETYRQCFDKSPDFAIELVKAIRSESGGMLFDDPTELKNPCDYHDHEDGPNCHVKGKGRVKHTRKTPAPLTAPSSTKSTHSTNSALPPHPLPPPPKTPRQLPPRQARLQDRASVGPLRRRLTSPAISTVGTSPETAMASLPPNLDAAKDREKWRKMPSLEHRKILDSTETQSHLVPGEPRRSLENRPKLASERRETIEEEEGEEQQTPSRRGLWEWARNGSARLDLIGRIPRPEWRGPVFIRNRDTVETQDDFSVPSSTATEPDNVTSPSFAQTKQSSDDLIATASSTGSPAWQQNVDGAGEACTPSKDSAISTPDTPTPQQRRKEQSPTSNGVHAADTPTKTPAASETPQSKTSKRISSPHSIPTYKIALAPNLLSSARGGTATT